MGTWSLPYRKPDALKLKNILEQLDEYGFALLKDQLYPILGNDELFDVLDIKEDEVFQAIRKSIRQIVIQYEKEPTNFKGTFSPASLKILKEIAESK
jgi:hypothetical protein